MNMPPLQNSLRFLSIFIVVWCFFLGKSCAKAELSDAKIVINGYQLQWDQNINGIKIRHKRNLRGMIKNAWDWTTDLFKDTMEIVRISSDKSIDITDDAVENIMIRSYNVSQWAVEKFEQFTHTIQEVILLSKPLVEIAIQSASKWAIKGIKRVLDVTQENPECVVDCGTQLLGCSLSCELDYFTCARCLGGHAYSTCRGCFQTPVTPRNKGLVDVFARHGDPRIKVRIREQIDISSEDSSEEKFNSYQ